jgi:hypothetical protein
VSDNTSIIGERIEKIKHPPDLRRSSILAGQKHSAMSNPELAVSIRETPHFVILAPHQPTKAKAWRMIG